MSAEHSRASRKRSPSASTKGLVSRYGGVAGIVIFVVTWEIISVGAGQNASHQANVPGLQDILPQFKSFAKYWHGGLGIRSVELGGPITWPGAVLGLAYNGLYTASRAVIGIVIGSAAGIILAATLGWSILLRRIFSLSSHLLRLVPSLALVPLFMFWFGSSEQGVVLFVAFSSFVVVYIQSLHAIDDVPDYLGHYAGSLGASRRRAYVTAVLPAALPHIRGGLLLAVVYGWSAVIGAEFLGQHVGLGRIVVSARDHGATNVLGLVSAVVVVCAAIHYVVSAKVLRWLTRWDET